MELERIKIPKLCQKSLGISTFPNTTAFQRNRCLEMFESFLILVPPSNYMAFLWPPFTLQTKPRTHPAAAILVYGLRNQDRKFAPKMPEECIRHLSPHTASRLLPQELTLAPMKPYTGDLRRSVAASQLLKLYQRDILE